MILCYVNSDCFVLFFILSSFAIQMQKKNIKNENKKCQSICNLFVSFYFLLIFMFFWNYFWVGKTLNINFIYICRSYFCFQYISFLFFHSAKIIEIIHFPLETTKSLAHEFNESSWTTTSTYDTISKLFVSFYSCMVSLSISCLFFQKLESPVVAVQQIDNETRTIGQYPRGPGFQGNAQIFFGVDRHKPGLNPTST